MGRKRSFFVSSPPDYLLCPVCAGVFTDPVHTPCDHYFCRACLPGALSACPSCEAPLTAAQLSPPTRLVTSVLFALPALCENRERGCGEQLGLQDMLAHERVCGLAAVSCRFDGCEFAANTGRSLLRKDADAHERACRHRPPPSGGEEQAAGQADIAARACEIPGCPFTLASEDARGWEEHHRTRLADHVRLVADVVRAQDQLIVKQMRVLGDQERAMRNHEAALSSLPHPSHGGHGSSADLGLTAGDGGDGLGADASLLAKVFSSRVTWAVSNFHDQRVRGERITSPELTFGGSSLPRKHRYTFRLMLDPCGLPGHLGVFFIPRAGANSALLEWPIRQSVSIRLLSTTGGQEVQRTLDVHGNPNVSQFFERHAPPAPDNSVGHGFPQFVPLAAMDPGRGYLQGGNLAFFEVCLERVR